MFTLKDLTQLQWQHDCSKTKMPTAYVPKTKFSDKKSNDLEKAICAYINLMGGMAERRKNMGRVIDDRKIVTDVIGHQRVLGGTRYIPGTGRNGTADCSGVYKGKPVAIEVKIGRDRMSPDQLQYQQDFEKAGGIYIIARNFEQFVHDLRERFGEISLGEKYPCPKCKSINVQHTLTASFCPDCDYDTEDDD